MWQMTEMKPLFSPSHTWKEQFNRLNESKSREKMRSEKGNWKILEIGYEYESEKWMNDAEG